MGVTPFFIIGAPRSGTTMLMMALNRHSQIVVPPETHFFTLLLRSHRGQLRHWNWIEQDLNIRVNPPTHRIRPGLEAREHFWRLATAYLQQIGKEGVSHFGDKTPDHQLRIPGILRTFPEARFVLIYRDGRDVALSLSKVPWMPKNLDAGFLLWLHYYRIQRRLLQQEPQRVICVRYEDLVRYPEQELSMVLDFVGLPYEAPVATGSGNRQGMLDYEMSFKGSAAEPITADRVGTWRRELPLAAIARLESWGGWALRELHYDCVTDGRKLIPPWHVPWTYGRLGCTVALRTLQRKFDEVFGTCLYHRNRTARDLQQAGRGEAGLRGVEHADLTSSTWASHQ